MSVGAAWGIADPSPFCLKVENFLREANIAYDVVSFDPRRSFAKAPKGKLPFIEDEDGAVVGDSTLIIARLSGQRGIDMDAPLDDRQRCVSLAFRRMLDEHLYWVVVYSRWLDEPGWSVIRQPFFAGVWGPMRPLASALARRRVARALRAQGTGRHSKEKIYARRPPCRCSSQAAKQARGSVLARAAYGMNLPVAGPRPAPTRQRRDSGKTPRSAALV